MQLNTEKSTKKSNIWISAIAIIFFHFLLGRWFLTDHNLSPWHHSLVFSFLIILFMDLFDQHFESVIYIGRGFSTDLNERNSKLSCQTHTILNSNGSFTFKIAFSSHENFIDVTGRVSINLGHPFTNILKRRLVCDWVSKYNSCGSFVISLGNILEPLLASGVPDLHFVLFFINH